MAEHIENKLWFYVTSCAVAPFAWKIHEFFGPLSFFQKGWNQKENPVSIKIFDCWVMGFVLKKNCKKKPFIVFHFGEFQKQQQEDIAVSPQYWAKAAASKVVEQQASPKISNFPFWFSQNQKTNSILRKGFEIENSLAVMSPLNGHNKGPYKRSFWIQHLCVSPFYMMCSTYCTRSLVFW